MESNVEIKEMPEMKVIYCRHTGPFNRIGDAYAKLARWAPPWGLYVPNVTKALTVMHDDPSVTEVEKVRQSACILIIIQPILSENMWWIFVCRSNVYRKNSAGLSAEE